MTGTLQVRFTGPTALVKALYDHLHAKIPRGSRGGSLYRCTLRDRDKGIAQLYADVPAHVYADLFDPSFRSAQSPAHPSMLAPAGDIVYDGVVNTASSMVSTGQRYLIGPARP
jgi:hypothetical protein